MGASISWNTQDLSRTLQELLYLYLYVIYRSRSVLKSKFPTSLPVLKSYISHRVFSQRHQLVFFLALQPLVGGGPLHCRRLMIILRYLTLRRAYVDEWSAPRRDLYLTMHNVYKIQTSTTPGGIRTRQSKQTSGRRLTPYAARPLGSAISWYSIKAGWSAIPVTFK